MLIILKGGKRNGKVEGVGGSRKKADSGFHMNVLLRVEIGSIKQGNSYKSRGSARSKCPRGI